MATDEVMKNYFATFIGREMMFMVFSSDFHGIFTNPSFIVDLFMPCGCMVFALSIYNYSRALRTESLLLIISSSGMSSTSASLCPFGLKCCGTASSVLCCMALRCSPNLSRNARFVCPKYSAGVLRMFSHWRHCIM